MVGGFPELVKRILKWPKHFSNNVASTVLEVPSMKSTVLIWWLKLVSWYV